MREEKIESLDDASFSLARFLRILKAFSVYTDKRRIKTDTRAVSKFFFFFRGPK